MERTSLTPFAGDPSVVDWVAPWRSGRRLDLAGCLALVTGASRGVGRGIAVGLGSCGASVVVTGRSLDSTADPYGLGSSILETSEEVRAAGGLCAPIQCDHADDVQVEELFRRLDADHGQLRLLVNNAWGGYESIHTGERWRYGEAFWEQPAWMWDEATKVGVRGAYMASWHAARRMVAQRAGLIVNVSAEPAVHPDGRVVYGIAKSSVSRMALDMAIQLRPFSVASMCLMPGLVRTSSVLLAAKEGIFDLDDSESPALQGLAIAAMAADEGIMDRSGSTVSTAELCREYGFLDIDGRSPRLWFTCSR